MVIKSLLLIAEGYLTSCTIDYLSPTDETRAFIGIMFTICYIIPVSLVIFFYSQIVSHVFNHEKALREQVTCILYYVIKFLFLLFILFHRLKTTILYFVRYKTVEKPNDFCTSSNSVY